MKYVPFGACFARISDCENFKMGDIKVSGGNCLDDMVQVLESTKAAVKSTYCFISESEAIDFGEDIEGWWSYPDLHSRVDDVSFPLGTGFLGSFGTRNANFVFSGQVIGEGMAFDCVGQKYVLFANIAPREIKLGEIILVGGNCLDDNVQVLEGEKASVKQSYCYISEEEAMRLIEMGYGAEEGLTINDVRGWWNYPAMDKKADDVKLDPGAALLAKFGTENITICYPPAIKGQESK